MTLTLQIAAMVIGLAAIMAMFDTDTHARLDRIEKKLDELKKEK